MHWILDNNIFDEEGYDRLVAALDRLGVSHSEHKSIPFSGEITEREPLDKLREQGTRFYVMGSYSLTNWAVREGFMDPRFVENLDFRTQRDKWGSRMLNHDAQILPFGMIPFLEKPHFLRPVLDTKAFTGAVFDEASYRERLALVRAAESDQLNVNTEVMLCSKKEIHTETRCWVVGRKVVTASLYKRGTIKMYEEIRGTIFDNDVLAFAQERVWEWSPNPAYVMDVAETPDGLKIVEVNNLNSAGMYCADMQRLVHAIEAL